MKNSIKRSFFLINIIMVILTYITTTFLHKNNLLDLTEMFNPTSFMVIVVICLIALILSIILVNIIIFPLKKIEKSMKNVADGKILESKSLKSYSKFLEINTIIEAYEDMMQVIRKNTFDLNSQQSKTEIILEHMADGVVAFSVSRQVVHMNKSAIRLLNMTGIEDTFEKITKKLGIQLDFDKVMYLPNYKSIEERIIVLDNVLNVIFVPFYSDKLIPMGAIMVVRNITENVKLDNMRKEFVANVSHELKTPLTAIKGYSETIMNFDLSAEDITRFSKVIYQEANRMDRLVSDLLQLSRFDYKRVNLKKMMFSLDELVKNVCEKMKYSAKEKNHTLECIVTVAPPKIYADKDAIEQVIVNIISNSIKYTKDGGQIKVYVGAINESAYFKVIDNGIGIPAKDLNRIFERFYRVDKARSRSMGGTGLGLSIVKEIIESNSGTIELKSEIEKGTEVIVTLPTKIV